MLNVTILSSHDVLFSGQAHHVVFPGEQGVFEVLPFHRPLVSRLLPGIILIDEQLVPIQRGVVKVESDSITAIVEPDSSGGVPNRTAQPF
jgi:F-type H+-transporting ATPase subunit epsilon